MKHFEFNHQSLSEILHAIAVEEDKEIRISFTDNSVLHNPESKKIVRSFAKSKGKAVHISHVSDTGSSSDSQIEDTPPVSTAASMDSFEENEVSGDEPAPDPQTQFLIDKDIATDEDLESIEEPEFEEEDRRLEEVVSKADGDTGSSASDRLTQTAGHALSPALFVQRYKFHIIAVIVGSLLLFGGGVSLLWYLPSADVSVAVSTKPLEREITISGVAGANVSSDSNQIALNKTEIKDTVTEEGKATGRKTVGDKAKGKATLRNYSVVNDLTLAKGTVLKVLGGEGDGLEYITTDNVTVPHGTETSSIDEEGVLTESKKPGKIDTSIEAVELGKQYNLSGGTRTQRQNQLL